MVLKNKGRNIVQIQLRALEKLQSGAGAGDAIDQQKLDIEWIIKKR